MRNKMKYISYVRQIAQISGRSLVKLVLVIGKKGIPWQFVCEDGTVSNNYNDVMNKWKDCYNDLYNVRNDDVNQSTFTPTLSAASKCINTMNQSITVMGIYRAMAKIKSGKAVGYYNMPIEVLRNAISVRFMFKLFNKCFNGGNVPSSWLKGIITQVPKFGEVRHMHNCKHTAWAAAKRTNNVQMWNKFKYLRNKLKLMLRDKRNSFMSDLALSLKNNAKRFWTFCRLNTNSCQIPAVVSDGQNDVTDAADKAKMFNDYFHSVFSTPKTGIALPAVSVKSDNMLANIVFSEIDVINVLKGLDVNKGSGPDDIPLKVLRECADELAPSLTTLFNLSMSTCTLPEVWKYSNVVPIHKKGKKCKVDNYRPISLLNSVSKVMERLVFNHIYPVHKLIRLNMVL